MPGSWHRLGPACRPHTSNSATVLTKCFRFSKGSKFKLSLLFLPCSSQSRNSYPIRKAAPYQYLGWSPISFLLAPPQGWLSVPAPAMNCIFLDLSLGSPTNAFTLFVPWTGVGRNENEPCIGYMSKNAILRSPKQKLPELPREADKGKSPNASHMA